MPIDAKVEPNQLTCGRGSDPTLVQSPLDQSQDGTAAGGAACAIVQDA